MADLLPTQQAKSKPESGPLPLGQVRHLVLVSALACFTLVSANTTSFSLTVICMTRNSNRDGNVNATFAAAADDVWPSSSHLALSSRQQNSLFSAAALGSILSGLTITSLIHRFGLRAVLCTSGLISGLASLALPFAASLGFSPLFAVRMLQGSAGPAQFVMVGAIARDWAPAASSGAYLMLLSAHFQFGRVLGMPLAAAFCDSDWGWPPLYFLLGLLTLVAFAAFFFLYRDNPREHPLVSEFELRKIAKGKAEQFLVAKEQEEGQLLLETGPVAVPYHAILCDFVVWLILLTYWSDELGFEMLGQFGPTYLNRVLDIDIRHTGLLSALPYLLAVFVKVLAGWLYKHLPCTGEQWRINLFTALSQLGMAFCFYALAILPAAPKMPFLLIQTAFTSVNLFCGLDFLGVVKSSQRISQQFSHVLMAWNSIISSITVFLLPLGVTLFAPNNSVMEWSTMFTGIASLQLLMVLLFFAFCNSEPREWTKMRPASISLRT